MSRMRRRYSRKRNALEEILGRPWEVVALEYDRKPMTQAEIAAEWTTLVSRRYPDVVFTQRNVSDAITLAKEARQEVAA